MPAFLVLRRQFTTYPDSIRKDLDLEPNEIQLLVKNKTIWLKLHSQYSPHLCKTARDMLSFPRQPPDESRCGSRSCTLDTRPHVRTNAIHQTTNLDPRHTVCRDDCRIHRACCRHCVPRLASGAVLALLDGLRC